MRRRLFGVIVLIAWVAWPSPILAQSPANDPDVAKGIAQVDEGDYDAAILTLDKAAHRLTAQRDKTADLAQAYLYLGVAYLGKGHEASARLQFRQALSQVKDLSLSPERFAPRVIEIFNEARETATTASVPPARASPPKKGGRGKTLLILGGVAVVGAAVGVAALGGGTETDTDTRREERQGPIALPAGGSQRFSYDIGAAGTLDATLTWTNPASSFHIYYGCCGPQSNRTTNTTSTLSLPVEPGRIELLVLYDSGPGDSVTLTVRHP